MTGPRGASTETPPLAILRLRLTAWYVGTLALILAILGGGIFLTMSRQVRLDLDRSLHDAVTELTRAAHTREIEAASGNTRVIDAVDELHIPDRTLYLFDSTGGPIKPAIAADWIRQAAAQAASLGQATAHYHERGHEGRLRLYAERFTLDDGHLRVAVAVANEIELEDRYAALFAIFGGAAFAAVLLVAGGGWFLVRKSTQPVERSMDQMRQFMADAAHELRTPIAVVRTRADVALQQDRPAGEYTAALSAISADSERLGRIVDDLLTLARADAGQGPVDRTPVYLDDVALDAADAAKVIAQQKGVSVVVDDFEEALVDGDATLLRQLVVILLDNAVKFTPAGGTVRIAVGTRDDRPTLTVDDTGIGIPADQLPRVFERFFRGDPARGRDAGNNGSGEGVGLGLSIAKWIADAHGASIELTCIPGVTRATVVFPIRPASSS